MSNFDFLAGGTEAMSLEDMVSVALRAGDIRKWLKDIEETLIDLAYEKGANVPGLKVVRGSGRRSIKDADAFLKALEDGGFVIDGLSTVTTKLSSISTIERKLGVKLEDSPGSEFVTKSPGSLMLVPEADPRKGVSKADESAGAYSELFQ